MKNRHLNGRLLLSIAVSAGLLLLSFCWINFAYSTNDDLGMISILNGSFTGTPDGHAIFLKYPLGWLIALLYRTGIEVSWYQITLMAAYLIAMISICFRLLKRLPAHPVVACLLMTGGICLLWLSNIMCFTFTTCGAFIAAALILAYALQKPEEDLRPGYLINLLLLCFLAYNIRDVFGYLSIAFLGVIWLAKYQLSIFRNRRCWILPLAAFLVLGVSIGINQLAYRDWDEFMDYNDARVYLQDYYNFPSYSGNEELIESLGYDQASYYTISHYDYGILPSFSPEVIFALSDYAKSQEPEESTLTIAKRTLKRAIDYYFVDSFDDIHPLQAASYLLPFLLLVWSIVCSVRDRKWYILFSGLMLFGIGCCYLLIGYRGRFPNRVAYSLRILTIAASLAGLVLLMMAHPLRLKKESLRRPVAVCGAALLLLVTIWGFTNTRAELGTPEEHTCAEYLTYIAQYPDNIYVRDTRSTQYDKSTLSEFPKLSPNVISTGGWTFYSPLYYEKLAYMGLDELNRDTLFLDHVYLIVNEKYSLNQILGVSEDAVIEYELVKSFDDGVQILKIERIED